jgi:lantibiotic biosynthesis protein
VRHAVPRDGFHSGSLGIAWAAARAGALLDEEELRAGAPTALPPAEPGRRPDVGMGAAGAVLALLALGRVDAAIATGEPLLARARVTRHGWSWAPGHLCGLSHGAAGIGLALLELFAATEDERFRDGAEGAFAYERTWLDPASGTWPDLRIAGQRRATERTFPPATTGTWCHGEAGIALTRLRAVEVLGADPHGRDAELALETTARRLAAALPHEIDDLSLCHGLAGPADVLLSANDGDLAAELAHVALERYAVDRTWPCLATPALFLGHSGIGWLFLRLHDPATPSPLVLPRSVDSHSRLGVGSAGPSRP